MSVEFVVGDCREALKNRTETISMCVTSPPYYWARDYGVETQIGHEKTVEDYVIEIADVFDLVKTAMADDGTLWLNLGDSYYSGNGQPTGSDPRSSSRNFMRQKLRPLDVSGWDIPKKSLIGIPWLVALEMQKRGWTLRSEIIWCRATALPEASVKDRPHRQHEHLFLFSKSRRYFFNRAALPEESVWHIAHERGVRGHCAPYPMELARRCIEAGSRAGGLVLDPFAGSGTTGLAALQLGRSALLIELNPEFSQYATERISTFQPHLAWDGALAAQEPQDAK